MATVKVKSGPPVKTTMTTCREWIAIGKSLDLAGRDLIEFVVEQQKFECEERQAELEERTSDKI